MIPIIDTGHGYNTPGKQSTGFYDNDGRVLLKENSFNEAIGNKLSYLYWMAKKEYYFISNEWYDISLDERVKREKEIAKKVYASGGRSLFISIHADAFDKDGPTGGRFFYYSDSGKKIADKMTAYFKNLDYPLGIRQPLQANFKVLRETQSPAILFEAGFMTTKYDLDFLLDDDFRNRTTQLLYNGINFL